MKDIDQTNIYSYKGDDYCKALKDYLASKGIKVASIELEAGYVILTFDKINYKFPQYAQWQWIVERISKWIQ